MISFRDQISSFAHSLEDLKFSDQQEANLVITRLFLNRCAQPLDLEIPLQRTIVTWLFKNYDQIDSFAKVQLHKISNAFEEFLGDSTIKEFERVLDRDFERFVTEKNSEELATLLAGDQYNLFEKTMIFIHLSTDFSYLCKLAKQTQAHAAFDLASKIICHYHNINAEQETVNIFAEILIKNDPKSLARNINAFVNAGLTEDNFYAYTNHIIQVSPVTITSHIQSFIYSSKNVNRLAVLIANKNPWLFTYSIKYFIKAGLKVEYVNELAKRVVKKHPSDFADHIEYFIQGNLAQEKLNKFALFIAQESPNAFACNIEAFLKGGLTNSNFNACINHMIEREPMAFTANVRAFVDAGLSKGDFEMHTKRIIEIDPMAFADDIKNFVAAGLSKKNFDIYTKSIIQKCPEAFAENVQNFVDVGLSKEAINHLAKIIIVEEPRAFAFNILAFINNTQNIEELATIVADEDPQIFAQSIEFFIETRCLSDAFIIKFLLKNPTILVAYPNFYFPDVIEDNRINDLCTLIKKVSNECIESTEKILKTLTNAKEGRKSRLIWVLYVLGRAQTIELENKKIIYKNLCNISQNFNTQNQIDLANVLFDKIAKDKDKLEIIHKMLDFLDQQPLRKNLRNGLNDFIIYLASLHKTPYNNRIAVLKALLASNSIKKIFNDRKMQLQLLILLKEIDKKINLEHLHTKALEILTKIISHRPNVGSERKGQIQKYFTQLRAYIKLSPQNLEAIDDLNCISRELNILINHLFPSLKIENFSDKYLKVFGSNPGALPLYATLHQEDPMLQSALETYITWAVESQFYRRYHESNSAHLNTLFKDAQLKRNWMKNASLNSINEANQHENLTVIETDDPLYLFTCGQVGVSCLKLGGNPTYNKNLIGYLIDGKNRMIALIDNQKNLKARSIIRLLLNQENQPILFLEKCYPTNTKDHALITRAAIEKAKQLKIPLLTVHFRKGKKYEGTIRSIDSNAPYEYADACMKQTDGKWQIDDACILWDPKYDLMPHHI